MAVTFDSHVAGSWNPDTGTMRFIADQDGTAILCAVSREALEDRSRTTGLNVSGLRSVFEQYRVEIEQKAAAKIQTDEFEPNGTILVRTSDLNGESASEATSVANTDEFALERDTDSEIWVRHRASGHVYQFRYLDGSKWASEYTIVPDLSSTVGTDALGPAARRAAREYLRRLETVRTGRTSLPDQPPPRPPQQPPTGWMGTDDATVQIVQQTEARRRAQIAATAGVTEPPLPPPATPGAPPGGFGSGFSSGFQGPAVDAMTAHERRGLIADALDALPQQTSAASQFALDASGRIDVIPDPPSVADEVQRELYDEMRRTARELADAGHNQLGELDGAANAFLAALPDRVEAASIARVWSRGNTLRLRLEAHLAVTDSAEPTEPARLMEPVAARLRDVVQNFNAFISGDPKGRELDDRRHGPDAREDSVRVVEAAVPLVEAVRASGIATIAAIDVLAEQLAAAQAAPAPGMDNDRATGLARRSFGNFILTALRAGLAMAVAGIVGDEAVGVIAGSPHAVVTYLVSHAPELTSFADHAMHNPAVTRAIEAIARAGAAM
jgi:hypothetical protein